MESKINAFMDMVKQRNNHEPEFLQAVQEVAETVIPYIVKNDIYHGKNILLRMVEPERLFSFRVSWVDDSGEIQVNRGYRKGVSRRDMTGMSASAAATNEEQEPCCFASSCHLCKLSVRDV